MKAGTATKMVLNMLTTGAMVLLGKTYGNLMVDMNASNSKLLERAKRIVCTLTNLAPEQAASLLETCNGEVKTAITSYRLAMTPEEARVVLHATNGHLRAALESMGRLNGRASQNGHSTSNGHGANGHSSNGAH
jgi:N-acetylmuramic acid 6-phosphate etherase